MVESVEVVMVGHIMCDDLSINDVALIFLTDFEQSLNETGSWIICRLKLYCGRIAVTLGIPVSHWR